MTSNIQQVLGAVTEVTQSEQFEQFRINARDFLSARESGESVGTQIAQMSASLNEAAEIFNRSFAKEEDEGAETKHVNVISPVVIPKDTRSYRWVFLAIIAALIGIIGFLGSGLLNSILGTESGSTFFGIHFWIVWFGYVAFNIWRNSFVMIPDGCQALITRFGKVEDTVGAGRTVILNPWKQVSYIVNTTKEYPYNAPIREAPTSSRINASVDLFLQFRIEDPSEFIFTLGGVNGFSEKLHNSISEVTRALIYEQKAEAIYDLVGETTQSMLEQLNNQFLPAVRFVNANITHAEPSSQEYRMDLAAAEMVRVGKEAYTYQYELSLRKEQDEGELNKELAELREQLSSIQAEVAKSQAQINTAREKEINRANAYARQLMVEAESEAKANSALLEAQALDIRAVTSSYYPEILEYRYQQDILEKVQAVADKLPQVLKVGNSDDGQIDFMRVAKQMMGIEDVTLYSDADMEAIIERRQSIIARIKERSTQIRQLTPGGEDVTAVLPNLLEA